MGHKQPLSIISGERLVLRVKLTYGLVARAGFALFRQSLEMVPRAGLEPALDFSKRILSLPKPQTSPSPRNRGQQIQRVSCLPSVAIDFACLGGVAIIFVKNNRDSLAQHLRSFVAALLERREFNEIVNLVYFGRRN